MIRVKQAQLHDPDNNIYGDCFKACLASILEMQLDDVPHFCDKDNSDWYKDCNNWLAMYNLCLLNFPIDNEDTLKAWKETFIKGNINLYHLISGPSPRFPDADHSVVGKNGDIIFDPHPDNTNITKITDFSILVKTGV